MINLANVLRPGGPFTQAFTIQRATGAWTLGGYSVTTSPIAASGVITVAKARDLAQVPEGDRVEGSMLFFSTTQMNITSVLAPGGVVASASVSDTIAWRGDVYRLAHLWAWADYGFWKALGVRISGE